MTVIPYDPIHYAMGEVAELFDTIFIDAEIIEVHRDDNTADIETDQYGRIDGVQLHYHCENKSNTNDAHWAFSEGDHVKVLIKKGRGETFMPPPLSEIYIVGFSSGEVKRCIKKGVCFSEAPYLISGGWSYVALNLTASDPCDQYGEPEPTQLRAPVSIQGFPDWDFDSPITEVTEDSITNTVVDCLDVSRERTIRYVTLPEGCYRYTDFRQFGSMAVMPGTTAKLYTSSRCEGEPFLTVEGGKYGRLIWYDWDYFRDLENTECRCRDAEPMALPVYTVNLICRDYSYDYCTADYLSAAMAQWTGTIADIFEDGPELEFPFSQEVRSVKVE